MSKRQKIIDELKKGTSVEDICTELEVSTGYVYRIKREIEESERDKKNPANTEDDTPDGVVVDPAGGTGSDVEEDSKDVDDEGDSGEADKIERVGGVKKRKKRVKKDKKEKDEPKDEDEDQGGIGKWIKNQWKKMLLILTLLILLAMSMLSFSRMKPKEPKPGEIPRYPMMAG